MALASKYQRLERRGQLRLVWRDTDVIDIRGRLRSAVSWEIAQEVEPFIRKMIMVRAGRRLGDECEDLISEAVLRFRNSYDPTKSKPKGWAALVVNSIISRRWTNIKEQWSHSYSLDQAHGGDFIDETLAEASSTSFENFTYWQAVAVAMPYLTHLELRSLWCMTCGDEAYWSEFGISRQAIWTYTEKLRRLLFRVMSEGVDAVEDRGLREPDPVCDGWAREVLDTIRLLTGLELTE